MVDVTNLLLSVIENPMAEKGYRELKKYYESLGMISEAKAVDDLMVFRFRKPAYNTVSTENATCTK